MAHGGPLIGREAELIELERLLDLRRVVTVTGPGGCGKSRVALELVRRLRLRSVVTTDLGGRTRERPH